MKLKMRQKENTGGNAGGVRGTGGCCASAVLEKLKVALTLGALAATALTSANAQDRAAVAVDAAGGSRELVVMTRNLYQGADLTRIVAEADPSLVPVRVSETLAMVLANDFPARAMGIADEVESVRPDVIGLQEAALFQVQSPGDSLWLPPDQQAAAQDVLLDYVAILGDALARKGLRYKAVVTVTNLSMELPMVVAEDGGYRFDDVRLTDRAVLLVRDDLPVGHLRVLATSHGHFGTLLSLPVAGTDVPVLRGWCAADIAVRGRTLRVVNAHLEAWHPLVRCAQAAELLAGPAAVRGDLVCLGDFNSNANADGTDGYGLLLAGGLEDAWWRPGDPAAPPTWGREEDLALDTIPLVDRLDLVLYRGALDPVDRGVTGDGVADRVLSTVGEDRLLWHSDHAGVNVTFALP